MKKIKKMGNVEIPKSITIRDGHFYYGPMTQKEWEFTKKAVSSYKKYQNLISWLEQNYDHKEDIMAAIDKLNK